MRVDQLAAPARPCDRLGRVADHVLEPIFDAAGVAALLAEIVDLVEPRFARRLRQRGVVDTTAGGRGDVRSQCCGEREQKQGTRLTG